MHQMPPNIQINWKKRLYRAKQNKYLREEVQDYKDRSGLQFVKFDFVTGCQKVKLASVVKFEISLSLCVFFFVDIS